MQKFSFSPAVFKMWLKRYWVGAALMALVFGFASLAYGRYLSAMLKTTIAPEISEIAVFVSNSGVSAVFASFASAAGLVCAMLCFGYLHRARSATMLHCMPPRRESMFLSVTAAGLCLLLAPIALCTAFLGVTMAVNGVFSMPAIVVFYFTMCSVAAFTFSFGAFVAMLTGNTIAQGVLTVVLVNLPIIIETIVLGYCYRFLFGFASSGLATYKINPFYIFAQYLEGVQASYYMEKHPGIVTPVLFFIVSALFLLFAVLLYRTRHLERAGDVIAMPALRPFFRYGMAFLGAGPIADILRSILQLNNVFWAEILLALVGGALGYFVAQMLLLRSVKVFKNFRGLLVFCLVYCLVLVALYTDIGGYGSYKLNANDVEIIAVNPTNPRVEAAITGAALPQYATTEDLKIDDPTGYLRGARNGIDLKMPPSIAQQIIQQDPEIFSGKDASPAIKLQNLLAQQAKVLRFTRDTRAYSDSDARQYYSISIIARRTNGQVFVRNYSFFAKPEIVAEIDSLQREIEVANAVAKSKTLVQFAKKCASITLDYGYAFGGSNSAYTLNPGQWGGLFEAYQKDMENMAKDPNLANSFNQKEDYLVAGIEMKLDPSRAQRYGTEYVDVYSYCTNTIDWMVEKQILSKLQAEVLKELN